MNTTPIARASFDPCRRDAVRALLQRTIADGARRAAAVLATLQREAPRDHLVRVRAASFATDGGVRIRVGTDWLRPTDHALGQVAERASIPLPYLRQLTAPKAAPWQHALAADILTEHHSHADDSRVLVRTVGGTLRGWLSDKYRRLDSRPLVEALADEASAAGAVPIDGVATETRVALKIILPEILEPLPGEFLAYGGEWSNSDYGHGVHAFRLFALRVVCLNGMTAENVLKQVHLGARLPDDIAFSERTHQLDTEASASALRDIVKSALAPAARERLMATIRDAHERDMSKSELAGRTRTLPKGAARTILDAFDSEDVINLPSGHTAWRASNAVSWVARHTDDPELRLDLERAAGALV